MPPSNRTELDRQADRALVETLSGDILIADAGSAEGMSASTVSGRLVVKGVKTRTLELATISGDLVLVNIACDRAQVRSVSGTMEFAGPLVKNGRYEFTSHAGDVRLTLAGTQGFELAAKTFSGSVEVARADGEKDKPKKTEKK